MQSAAYLVVVQLLMRESGARRSSMYRELDFERAEVDAAIAELERAGVVTSTGRTVWASPALALLDDLNLIAV